MTYETPRTDNPGANLPPVPGDSTGLAGAEGRATDAGADMETNELHAEGATCVRCGRAIGPADDVRHRLDGNYEHELCPRH